MPAQLVEAEARGCAGHIFFAVNDHQLAFADYLMRDGRRQRDFETDRYVGLMFIEFAHHLIMMERLEIEHDVLMIGQKSRHGFGNSAEAERGERRDSKQPAAAVTKILARLPQRAHPVLNVRHFGKQRMGILGRDQASLRSFEKRQPDRAFGMAQYLRYRRL
jgi:hypothetical protein